MKDIDLYEMVLMAFIVVWIVVATVIWWFVGKGEPLTLDPYG